MRESSEFKFIVVYKNVAGNWSSTKLINLEEVDALFPTAIECLTGDFKVFQYFNHIYFRCIRWNGFLLSYPEFLKLQHFFAYDPILSRENYS